MVQIWHMLGSAMSLGFKVGRTLRARGYRCLAPVPRQWYARQWCLALAALADGEPRGDPPTARTVNDRSRLFRHPQIVRFIASSSVAGFREILRALPKF